MTPASRIQDVPLVEPEPFEAGDHVRALHRLDAPSAGRYGPEPQDARRGRIVELNGFWPVALVRFACGGLRYVPLLRLDHDDPVPACTWAGCNQPRWEGPWCTDHTAERASAGAGTTAQATPAAGSGGPAAGTGRAVTQPPSSPSEPRRTGSAAGREEAGAATAPASNRGGRKREYSDEVMLHELQTFAEEHGRSPSQPDFRVRRPSAAAYKRRFGSWGNALRAAGLEPSYGRPRKRAA